MSYLTHLTVDERPTHSPGPCMDFADPINFDGASSETDNIIGDDNSFTSTSGLGPENRGDPMVIDAEGYVCHHIPLVPSATLTPTQYTPISASPGPALFCPHHAVPVNICSPALVQAAENFGSVPAHGFSPTLFGEDFSGTYPSIQPPTASHQYSDTYSINPPVPSAPQAMTRQQYSGPLSHHSPMNASPGRYSTNPLRPLGHSSSFPASTAAQSHDSPPFRGHGSRGRGRGRGRGRVHSRGRGGRQPHASRGHSLRGRSLRGRSPRGCTATDGQFPPAYQNHSQPPFGRGRPNSYKNSRRGHHPRHNQTPAYASDNLNTYSNQSGSVSSFGAGPSGPAIPTNNYPSGYQNSVQVFSAPRIHRKMHPELSDYSWAILGCIPPRLTPPAQRHFQQPSSEEQLPKHHLPENPNSDGSTYTAAMRLASFVSKGILGEIESRSKAKKTTLFSEYY